MRSMPHREGNEQGRLLAVGDIHGCLDDLQALMRRVRPTPEDRIVFLGDYVDRGPSAREVIDFLLVFAQRFPRSVFLKGNHEAMFLDYLAGRNRWLFLGNGGATTLESYREGGRVRIPPRHREFLAGLPLYHETEDFIFVHAGLRPGKPLAQQTADDLLWIREEFISSSYDWGKIIVYGHTPRPRPLFGEKRICVDTGAVFGNVLCCCDVERRGCWASRPPTA